jgi:hypothetical protein
MSLFAERPDGHVREGGRDGRRRMRRPLAPLYGLRRETVPLVEDRRRWAGGQMGRKRNLSIEFCSGWEEKKEE